MEKMKAIVYTAYGGPEVLTVQEVDLPQPKAGEVLIKTHAVSVNYGDILARNFKNISASEFNMPLLFWIMARFTFGISKPKKGILGNSFSGVVEKVGEGVQNFKPGEPVFGCTEQNMGAYAEYLCMPERGILAPKPAHLSHAEASTIPYGASMALCLLRKANIQKGQRVLILGASGGIGSAAVILARHFYDAEVTGVCSAEGSAYVTQLGAARVIDYKREDFTKSGETYDLIFDVLGRSSFSNVKASLTPRGIYLSVSFKMKKLLQTLWTSITGGKRVICSLAVPKPDDLIFIKNFFEENKMHASIDRTFPFEQTADAHRYYESGNKKGHVVITI